MCFLAGISTKWMVHGYFKISMSTPDGLASPGLCSPLTISALVVQCIPTLQSDGCLRHSQLALISGPASASSAITCHWNLFLEKALISSATWTAATDSASRAATWWPSWMSPFTALCNRSSLGIGPCRASHQWAATWMWVLGRTEELAEEPSRWKALWGDPEFLRKVKKSLCKVMDGLHGWRGAVENRNFKAFIVLGSWEWRQVTHKSFIQSQHNQKREAWSYAYCRFYWKNINWRLISQRSFLFTKVLKHHG